MKRRIIISLIDFGICHLAMAQSTPYTGGDGSGYLAQNSPPVICSNFFGGSADGAASTSSQPAFCPPFFGGNADGVSAAVSAPAICPPFFGGIADGFSSAQTVNCNVVVAAKIIKFYGEKESLRNILHWKVTDFDVWLFEVQKSSDGITFKAFGTVAGSTSNDAAFIFIDNAPFPAVTYYRLRIIERNSLVSYSDVVALRDGSKSAPFIYPNPSQGFVTLNYYSEKVQAVTITIFQADGKPVMTTTITMKAGRNSVPFNLRSLANGIYFIRIGVSGDMLKLILQ